MTPFVEKAKTQMKVQAQQQRMKMNDKNQKQPKARQKISSQNLSNFHSMIRKKKNQNTKGGFLLRKNVYITDISWLITKC